MFTYFGVLMIHTYQLFLNWYIIASAGGSCNMAAMDATKSRETPIIKHTSIKGACFGHAQADCSYKCLTTLWRGSSFAAALLPGLQRGSA